MPSRGTVGDPKTAKSKTPDPVIPQLAQRLAAYRLKCGNPLAGPISPNSVGRPLDLNACYQREMKRCAQTCWTSWRVAEREGFEPGPFSNRLVSKGMAKTLVNTGILTHPVFHLSLKFHSV